MKRHLLGTEPRERIAVGGMAELFRAKACGAYGFEKIVAIKRILPDLARDEEFEARFIREAKLAAGLAHANIVQVFDFGRLADSLYIAMEFVDGPDLRAVLNGLRKRGQLVPLPAAFRIATEFLAGLDFAHRKGIVHRDVSPSNVLISREGEVKVADFGIARGMSELSGTFPGSRIMGKWPYMAPEQTRGEQVDARSDVFSAAVVLFELFAGERLFAGNSSEEIVSNVRTMPIPALSTRRPELPRSLDDAFTHALARDLDKRMREASQLAQALMVASVEMGIVTTPQAITSLIAAEFPTAQPQDARQVNDLFKHALGGGSAAERATRTDDGSGTMFERTSRRADAASVWSAVPTTHKGPRSHRSRAPWLAAGFVSACAIGSLVWLISRQQPVSPTTLPAPFVAAGGPPPSDAAGAAAERRDATERETAGLATKAATKPTAKDPAAEAAKDTATLTADGPATQSAKERARKTARPGVKETAKTAAAKRPEQPPITYGEIDLSVEPWAEVYLDGKRIGRAPKRGLRLPVGRHKLQLVNPVLGRRGTIVVDVPSESAYQTVLP